MTTVTQGVVTTQSTTTDGVIRYQWVAGDSDDDGRAVAMLLGYDYYVQLGGTLGTGGSMTIRGTFDGGTTWGPLKDPSGADITLGAIGKIMHIDTWAPSIKPVTTAGDGTTLLWAYMYAVPRRN